MRFIYYIALELKNRNRVLTCGDVKTFAWQNYIKKSENANLY